MKYILKPILYLLCLMFLVSAAVFAEIPKNMSFQGKLTDSAGNELSGDYDFRFSIYTLSSGGASLWSEDQVNVSVVGVLYNVTLGVNTALNLPFDSAYYLEVAVKKSGTASFDNPMTPRHLLTASPYALGVTGIDKGDWKQLVSSGTTTLHSHAGAGLGDMTMAVYDSDSDNIVNDAESVRLLRVSASTGIITGIIPNSVKVTTGSIITSAGAANTTTFLRGDARWEVPAFTGNINTTQINAGIIPDSVKITTGNVAASGTPSGTTFLRGDGQWGSPAGSSFPSVVFAYETASDALTGTPTNIFSAQITPTSASNRVKATVCVQINNVGDTGVCTHTVILRRGITDLISFYAGTSDNAEKPTISFTFVDSPGTTSATVYYIRALTDSASAEAVNKTITLEEVGP